MIRLKKILKISSFILLPLIIIWSMIFGWGWFVPYNLQPSYHEFKEMCKLNELLNDEHKYNKILSYFGLSLDTLDWENIKKNSTLLTQGYLEYNSQNDRYMYRYENKSDPRIRKVFFLFFNDSIKLSNLYKIDFEVFWNDKRDYIHTKVTSYDTVIEENFRTCGYFSGYLKGIK